MGKGRRYARRIRSFKTCRNLRRNCKRLRLLYRLAGKQEKERQNFPSSYSNAVDGTCLACGKFVFRAVFHHRRNFVACLAVVYLRDFRFGHRPHGFQRKMGQFLYYSGNNFGNFMGRGTLSLPIDSILDCMDNLPLRWNFSTFDSVFLYFKKTHSYNQK